MSLLHRFQGWKLGLQLNCIGKPDLLRWQATVASVSSNDITVNAPSIVGVPGATTSNLFFANEPVIVYNNSSGASRGTTTVSSISDNVVTVASAPGSTDADDVIMPTISAASTSTLSPISMKNSAVYMAASGTAQGSLFASGTRSRFNLRI